MKDLWKAFKCFLLIMVVIGLMLLNAYIDLWFFKFKLWWWE